MLMDLLVSCETVVVAEKRKISDRKSFRKTYVNFELTRSCSHSTSCGGRSSWSYKIVNIFSTFQKYSILACNSPVTVVVVPAPGVVVPAPAVVVVSPDAVVVDCGGVTGDVVIGGATVVDGGGGAIQ
jgi:hypothetical protein